MDTPDRSADGVEWAPERALNTLTEKLRNELDLNSGEIGDAVTLLLTSEVDDQIKAEFLTALHKKGETAEEIAAFVRALMKRAVDPMIIPAEMPGPMIDVCGTGGDGLDLFNVSTTVAFVAAAGGAVVVKHGNRRVWDSKMCARFSMPWDRC
jgi:anthranilate phosphoribosyltransferase